MRNSYFNVGETCEKCQDADARHRFHMGYVAIKGGARWKRYWHLCTPCMKNAKIVTDGKQHPIWYFEGEEGEDLRLVRSDKTTWPTPSYTYGRHLDYPHG